MTLPPDNRPHPLVERTPPRRLHFDTAHGAPRPPFFARLRPPQNPPPDKPSIN